MQFGSIAQLGEHLPYKQRVTGSSPVVPTKKVMNASAFVTFLFCTGRETNSKFQTHARRAEIWEKGPVDLSIDERRALLFPPKP